MFGVSVQTSYESFTDDQIKVLEKYVTNTSGNVFVLRNLPEVIKGALFSRYSRSSLGLRSLLLKEFILNQDTSFESITGNNVYEDSPDEQTIAIKKAQNFYDRILDGFGDDSIGELGGAHLAVENVSIIAAKALEDARIGGSPLEKSTRYIYFDQKINDQYLFYKEPVIMTSAYRDLYLETCNFLFDTYTSLIPKLTALIEKDFPLEEHVSKVAYNAALRAKVLDCLRGLLPAGTLTNLGIFGNGRFYENLIRKLSFNNLTELRDRGKDIYEELNKVMPSFVRRTEPTNKYNQEYVEFFEKNKELLKKYHDEHLQNINTNKNHGVNLIYYDKDSPIRVAASLLFENSHVSLDELLRFCNNLPKDQITEIFKDLGNIRENRRHKSPRALEQATFTFEITADFGIYRDLQRHRILTQERQLLTCNYGYYIPQEIIGTEMEGEYEKAIFQAKNAYDIISEELPEEAQYIVPMAYNVNWYFHINLRSLQWLCELRSSPAGHPSYRYIAQEMANQICSVYPEFKYFFKFVDYEGYNLGRMQQEIRRVEKSSSKL